MIIHSDDEIAHFKIGDVVRADGSPHVMKIIEIREGMEHFFIEGARRLHYKCEWNRRDGMTYSAWFEAGKLEKLGYPMSR